MNIYMREMKANRKSQIIWSIGVVFLVATGMGKYAGMSGAGQSMNDLIAGMPKAILAIMGVGTMDLSTVSGYFGMLYIYLLLMATIHAVMLGATIIAKEERDKTVEFLFVKPVSRSRILSAKLLAALTDIIIFNIITWVSSIVVVGYVSHGEHFGNNIAITMVGMFIIQLLFLVIGAAIATLSNKPKKAPSYATGILLITYILSVAIDLNDRLESLKYFTPFKYFEAKNVMYGGGLETTFLLISIISILTLCVIIFMMFKKKDLNV